ncbi:MULTISPECIES: 50S ribosomal protein L21 [Chlamydia]|uniref:Large ribosomal subunit protein bL21 n=2 Tax=Chlamydia TaxID=810 RepID=A0ABN0MPW1_CHLPS|nr:MULTISPECIES: 50S ribosomal protein L21 [Chlamydia]AFS19203.1 ribosomal protein L21 [Chlamydia psittaci 84/55]AFS22401.1 ribosomal protein L21 [Chlamydia psittaci VS225]AGE74781.1 50S ribosomal protein L21 [Chlamydia psittaci Mat116]EPJ16029.1 ribosomal protein L21 [Chlamydia psittaci 02DC18]EPJ17095.1 ribosomal protein L21 [Chlamydia psittaci 02DC22]EPJ19886.1 ribosomal protein L21 [Chlamydia psittaci 02DC23]EPJ20986.1 ribosomal protein L21 [Chlamydia psittaci 02DC21]EPJ24121.1 ribosoma
MKSYAIIQTGSKQYQVSEGDIIDVELLDGVSEGQEVVFDQVLFTFDGSKVSLGTPTVKNAVVKGELLSRVRGEKVIAYKYKRRKNYHRKIGHRQNYLRVKISNLVM